MKMFQILFFFFCRTVISTFLNEIAQKCFSFCSVLIHFCVTIEVKATRNLALSQMERTNRIDMMIHHLSESRRNFSFRNGRSISNSIVRMILSQRNVSVDNFLYYQKICWWTPFLFQKFWFWLFTENYVVDDLIGLCSSKFKIELLLLFQLP